MQLVVNDYNMWHFKYTKSMTFSWFVFPIFFAKQAGKRRKTIDLLTSLTQPWNKLHSKARSLTQFNS